MNPGRRIKVAIVGGGCASIAAAFELSRPQHQHKFDITVYQLGWRLGGKGASGRGPADRIEEHGLHVWMGFYENAFRLMRECYEELGRDPKRCRIATWRDAFAPESFVGLTEPTSTNGWRRILSFFPAAAGLPGDPLRDINPFTISSYMLRTATMLRTLLLAIGREQTPRDDIAGATEQPSAESVQRTFDRLWKYGLLGTVAGLVEAVGLLEIVSRSFSLYPDSLLIRLLEGVSANARRQLEALSENDSELRRVWEVVDLALAAMLGVVRFGLLNDPRGFDAINDYDYREWLKLNGASERSVNSPIVRGTYDLAFAYEDGDFNRPRLAAGQALRGGLRMFFTYRGALFWKMQAGMGDVVFAPFYEVLKRRGVKFEFFHRLENVKLVDPIKLKSGERPYVEALEFDVQAQTRSGAEYEPLVDVRGLPCWPARPDYLQLVEGEQLEREGWKFESHWDRRSVRRKTLRVVEDFDFVVLGVGLGAVPYVCQEILARDQRWRDMVERIKTTPTQAFQIWMREDMESLGWTDPPVSLSGFVQPFDTWADMRQLLPEENWPSKPRAIAYFCSVLSDGSSAAQSDPLYEERRRDEVRRNAIRFLNNDVRHLWPAAAAEPGRFRWDLLIDPRQNGSDGHRCRDESVFDSQFWTANVNPSDRYVLSVPGSLQYRISPLDKYYDNLTIAGDWTNSGLNAGCVEAAMMSGRLAARAISLFPRLEDIVGYDHP